jgi:hypothetical protein
VCTPNRALDGLACDRGNSGKLGLDYCCAATGGRYDCPDRRAGQPSIIRPRRSRARSVGHGAHRSAGSACARSYNEQTTSDNRPTDIRPTDNVAAHITGRPAR